LRIADGSRERGLAKNRYSLHSARGNLHLRDHGQPVIAAND
jgi:hypothetical protein